MSPSRKVNEAGLFVVVEELAITASGMTGRMELVTAGVADANWEDSVWQPATAARVASASASWCQPGKEAAS